MRDDFLPFSRPSIDNRDIDAVTEVLRSGWITTGSKCAAFEQQFSQRVGCRESVAFSSATGAMHLLLKALDIGPGDEVITPSMTWVSTVNLIVLCGARPVFVDVDRHTLMTTAGLIAPALSERTRLIIPVHFAGAALDLDPIRKLAQQAGVSLVEDAAHGLGTVYKNGPVGRRGTAIFSFHPIKNITTAEGGMLCSDNPRLLERIRRLRFHGLGLDAYQRQSRGRPAGAEVLEPGFKYNLPDMAAALGISQLSRLQEFNRQRAALAAYYRQKLADIEEIIPLADPPYPMTHSWHLFIVRLDTDRSPVSRDEFMAALKARNIGTGLHFKAVHLHKYYRENMGTGDGMLPATEWNSQRLCSLPLFPAMDHADVDDVVNAIKEVLSR